MGRDRDDGDDGNSFLTLRFVGPVVPEYAVGSGRVVLRVGLEHLFASRTRERSELMRIQARVKRVYFEVTEGLANLLEDSRSPRRIFQLRVLPIGGWRKLYFSPHAYFLACLANDPR